MKYNDLPAVVGSKYEGDTVVCKKEAVNGINLLFNASTLLSYNSFEMLYK